MYKADVIDWKSYGTTPDPIPVISCVRDAENHLTFICPFCGHQHTHELNAFRVLAPQCKAKRSNGVKRYMLREVGSPERAGFDMELG